MNWPLPFKGDNSAPVARERLQILLAHERSAPGGCNLISILIEILAAVSRQVAVEPDKVQVKMDRAGGVSNLKIEIEIPNMAGVSRLSFANCSRQLSGRQGQTLVQYAKRSLAGGHPVCKHRRR